MAFVKTGADPAAIGARWSAIPIKLNRVIKESCDTLSKQRTGDIAPTTFEILHANGLFLEDRPDILCAVLNEIDVYIRAWRSTTMAMAIRDLEVDIIGDGWDHVSHLGGRARYWPGIHASGLEGLYAETQYLLNTTPNFASGVHERVLDGFATKCCVVSDDNAFSQDKFAHIPSYHGIELNDELLEYKIAEIYFDRSNYDERFQPALDYVNTHHNPADTFSTMIELAEIISLQELFSTYKC
jgi:hypothetical protein